MDHAQKPGQIVFTNKARCRDCYRCVRVCPVKAIRVHKGQAGIVDELCIACGTCIRECPQGAKGYRNDVDYAARLLKGPRPVAVSVAPSFTALLGTWEQKRLPSALRKLGFAYVAETASGAYHTAAQTANHVLASPDKSHICTACPAVVNFVERYRPEMVPELVPVLSPMLVHARMIKEKLGEETQVIFIGPCVAKKTEADRQEHKGLVYCALTFTELFEWLERAGIHLAECEESDFDETPGGNSRFFPLVGGLARTAGLSTDYLSGDVLPVSGFSDVIRAIDEIPLRGPITVEPLFCTQGCVGGPAMPHDQNLYELRSDVLCYAQENPGEPAPPSLLTPQHASFMAASIPHGAEGIDEDQIRQVLEQTGKTHREDQLNCGACGYPTCREKAIAVIRGMAEHEMCMPYMRRLAETRGDLIIETSPNGIVILDERLNILSMNQSFKRLFMCSDAICGKRISYLMDPEPFEILAVGSEKLVESTVRHEKYNLICHQLLYSIREVKQFVGIFVNITHSQENQERLEHLKAQTIMQARELLDHQITLAQKVAQFMGESTARGEMLVQNLMKIAGDRTDSPDTTKTWDMYTPKS